ncbi:MAG: indolepyruvate oxidoreductase subunit beta [Desulfatiglandales bacterium]
MENKKVVMVAVGGQGNILSARLLGEACMYSDIPAVVSEIHGMAQRGGIVETAINIGDIASPIVSPNEADVLIAFEPLEGLRALTKCNKDSTVIVNTRPLPPFTVAVGQGTYPPVEKSLELIRSKVKKVYAFDGVELAEKAENPLALNMVMLGAFIGLGEVPISLDVMKKVVSEGTKRQFLESNLKALELGYQVVKG